MKSMGQLNRRGFLQATATAAGAAGLGACAHTERTTQSSQSKPNIILIVADDLGYNELGCFGQTKIQTPNLDTLAADGMRFTQFYSGQAVCAPSRCVLMTGKHTGHSYIRNNSEVKPEGQKPIPEDTFTIAKMLKQQGYATAAIGKWGLGPPGSGGDPAKQGFDLFFGYNCQRNAHNYYPRYLYKNGKRVDLPGNDRGLTGEHFAPDLMLDEAVNFIDDNKNKPFFLYYPTPVPHLALQAPEDSIAQYKGKWDDPPYDGKGGGYLPHETPRACYAAMITRMDRDIGRILSRVEKHGLDENTLIIFSSDNGATFLKGPDTEFFESNKPLRAYKGSLYEGGIRVPTIARWTGTIKPGSVSNHLGAFWDILPTIADVTNSETPDDIDGISMAPTLFEQGLQEQHEYLYWEFPAYGGQQALRMGDWKAVRQNLMRKQGERSIQLYNLANDIGETRDVADEYPNIVKKMQELMQTARVPSDLFPFPALDI